MSSLSTVHCTCCHVCHVSMKQRPRQVLACKDCNTIICKVCLETRWKTSQWIDNCDSWLCLKCRGECPCKSCKGRKQGLHNPVSNKRDLSFMSDVSEDEVKEAGEMFITPRVAKKVNVQPGRQPSVPAGMNMNSLPKTQQHQLPRDKIGLGMSLMDAGIPVHLKVLELSEKKAYCEETIANVKGLLSILEEERAALDSAMNDLIKKTTSNVAQRLTRSNSQANLEESLMATNTSGKGFKRTPSSCNLEEMATESLSKVAGLTHNVF